MQLVRKEWASGGREPTIRTTCLHEVIPSMPACAGMTRGVGSRWSWGRFALRNGVKRRKPGLGQQPEAVGGQGGHCVRVHQQSVVEAADVGGGCLGAVGQAADAVRE